MQKQRENQARRELVLARPAAALCSQDLRKRHLQSIKKLVRVSLRTPVNSERGWEAVPVLVPTAVPLLPRLQGCYMPPLLRLQSVTSIEIINRAQGRGDTWHV